MAAMDPQQLNHHFGGASNFGSYDPKALKNYAAMSAVYWPGFDSGYAAAAYSQASALAAAATNLNPVTSNMSQNPGQTAPGSITSSGSPTPNGLMGGLGAVSSSSMGLASSQGISNGIAVFPAHSTTSGSPKKKPQPVPIHMKDDTYWERRKRNNDSARRSRESRRMKEEQIALRVVYLEQENLQLRTEVSMLRAEIEKMRVLLYNTTHHH